MRSLWSSQDKAQRRFSPSSKRATRSDGGVGGATFESAAGGKRRVREGDGALWEILVCGEEGEGGVGGERGKRGENRAERERGVFRRGGAELVGETGCESPILAIPGEAANRP